ncbi:hypothetical protein [Alkalihalobacterium alkalinitrilicum]|uniref:AtuA-related protein n=1 Tax=Alkalihalobacterium alkalinitrilicum TaxID=427920 RepID=UPI001EE44B8B|nr:hypothetical protein [Alkalihalobacterium alkalinitrilicum]
MRVLLKDIAQSRSGDKGNTADISLFANNEELFNVIKKEVTSERVKEHFNGICLGKVERFEVANVLALKFILHEALGGGGPRSLRIDNLGKSLSAALLRMEIEVPNEIMKNVEIKQPPKQFKSFV